MGKDGPFPPPDDTTPEPREHSYRLQKKHEKKINLQNDTQNFPQIFTDWISPETLYGTDTLLNDLFSTNTTEKTFENAQAIFTELYDEAISNMQQQC